MEPWNTPEEGKARIERIRGLYDGLGVAEDARAEIVRFSQRALEAVAGLHADTAPLKDFAERLVGRAR